MSKCQHEDKDLCYILNRIETGLPGPTKEEVSPTSPSVKFWCARLAQLAIRDGVLQYGWQPERPDQPIIWKTIVPRALRADVMSHLHDAKAAGHMGINKTWRRAQRCHFIWEHMREDVNRWVRRCQLCQQKKAPPFKKRAHLVKYQVGAPWERIAADVAGPFPQTDRGNRYILVVQDYFTKWVEICPMPDQTAETVANFLVDLVFARFGCCRYLNTDQGTNFESQVMREVCKLFGTQKTRTTPYHPRGDGMVERHNRTIEGMMALWTNTHQTDWDVHLPLLAMAYRSAPHDTTFETPNMLNFGREVTVPVDLVMAEPPDGDREDNRSQYAANLQEKLKTAQEAARAHMTHQMISQKRHYDQNVRLVTYQEGDLVWRYSSQRRKGKNQKLMKPWTGPFLIINKLSEVTFRIQASPRSRL